MTGGGTDIFIPLILLVALAVLVLLGASYARRHGHLRGRGSRIAAVAVIAVLAVLIWVGPAFFLAA